ncbi:MULTISPECIES: hypothetical protein [Lactococcus]|uniref:hypothetical protein n=1 Tax=Lactococcus TaxID=1357 RepID=UPI001A90C596|nr:hypothetical protein [Lactococcus sp. LG592]QSR09928.1 hypothetical protein JZX84_05635 [Lactococcus sp. LG592]
MYHPVKLKIFKGIGLVIALIIVFFIGSSVGSFVTRNQEESKVKISNQKAKQAEKKEDHTLSEENVSEFLTAFYTKKDLGENRNRYKPLMTEEAYTSQVSIEEEPVNQAYKGYVVDQAFEGAKIYIDAANKVAICVVEYSNTQLSVKGDYDKDKITKQPNTDTIKISFTEEEGKYLVNNIAPVSLSDDKDSDISNSSASKDNTTMIQGDK